MIIFFLCLFIPSNMFYQLSDNCDCSNDFPVALLTQQQVLIETSKVNLIKVPVLLHLRLMSQHNLTTFVNMIHNSLFQITNLLFQCVRYGV